MLLFIVVNRSKTELVMFCSLDIKYYFRVVEGYNPLVLYEEIWKMSLH